MKIDIVNGVTCPVCGAPEMNGDLLHIRVNKVSMDGVHWESQCLVCSGGYDKPFGVFNERNHDPNKGWFRT